MSVCSVDGPAHSANSDYNPVFSMDPDDPDRTLLRAILSNNLRDKFMKYQNPSFSVAVGENQSYQENYYRIFKKHCGSEDCIEFHCKGCGSHVPDEKYCESCMSVD